ncbi:hypothetical protein [Lysobacter sp. HA35]
MSGNLADCNRDTASLGSVTRSVALLERLLPGPRQAAVATASKGQMLCIHYVAEPRNGGDRLLYVTAVDASTVAACAHRCTSPEAAVKWSAAKPREACEVRGGAYSAGCASGWINADAVDTYDMGLPDTSDAPPLATYEHALPDVTVNGIAQGPALTCVVGARLDDIGQQSAVVAAFDPGTTTPKWTAAVPHGPDFYQNRATHCACSADRCYVLIATDTQAPQSTSQTLLSVVRMSNAGAIVAMHDLPAISGVPDGASVWADAGNAHFRISSDALEVAGSWRRGAEDDAHPFDVRLPLF